MPVDHDTGRVLLVGTQAAILIFVQEPQNSFESILRIVVGEDRSIQSERMVLLQFLGQLRFFMDEIVALDAAAHKTDHNELRCGNASCGSV